MIAPWSAAVLGALAVVLATLATPVTVFQPDRASSYKAPAANHRRYPVDSLASVIVRSSLFRRDRRAAPRSYAAGEEPPVPPQSELTRQIRLVGIVDGEPPRAVLEGFDGSTGGRVVQVGDLVGSVRIESIRHGTITVAVNDSTWTIGIRRPW